LFSRTRAAKAERGENFAQPTVLGGVGVRRLCAGFFSMSCDVFSAAADDWTIVSPLDAEPHLDDWVAVDQQVVKRISIVAAA
jgi:hypothetical protein